MRIDEMINYYHDKYWILISFDLTNYTKDRRITRYKIAFPKLVVKQGIWDVDMKDCDEIKYIRGSDIKKAINDRFKNFPEYEEKLLAIIERKTNEYKERMR